MAPRYKVTLTEEERDGLETITRHGKTTAPKFIHARALLLCDAGEHGPAWKVADIAEALGQRGQELIIDFFKNLEAKNHFVFGILKPARKKFLGHTFEKRLVI